MEALARLPSVERDADLETLVKALGALRRGDASVALPTAWEGLYGKVAAEFNQLVVVSTYTPGKAKALKARKTSSPQPSQRSAETRLTGFWLENLATVNNALEEAEASAEQNKFFLASLIALKKGDATAALPLDWTGLPGKLADAFNDVVAENVRMSDELARLSRVVGQEGKLKERARVPNAGGFWRDSAESINSLIADLVHPTSEVARVIGAVAKGDMTQKMAVEVDGKPIQGEFMRTAKIVNTTVDQLGAFAGEVTRVAREVGSEGKLGGQAQVVGVAGIWNDLTVNVNQMAANLTDQVRAIAVISTAVVSGDMSKKITVDAKGELLALKNTVNTMVDQLGAFAGEVTRVAREVGTEGKLGGQAQVVGVAGIWNDLTVNVNLMAANLTTQVRAIADVATAVTKGDLTRSIGVTAEGELAALKDNLNEMIRNLKDTTDKNTEQDWLKTNLAKFSRMLQGQKDLVAVGHLILSELAPVVGAQQAEFYVLRYTQDKPRLRLIASYASEGHGAYGKEVDLGQGLVGQCAYDKQKILLTSSMPEGLKISSGLTGVAPLNILVLPIIFEEQVRGVVELASIDHFNPAHQAFLDQLTESIGIVINTIEANTRTEDLLTQSQSLAQELQSRQQELQQTNEELQEKARLLVHQNHEVERKNQEVEQARQALEEKAKQLSLTSKYKSEFLANMSHELRTPLNSLLILSDQLCKNPDGNLVPKQVEFAKTIHSSGNDLLMLINDILDLSKIESGTVVVDISEIRLSDLQQYVERSFRHVAEAKNIEFLMTTGLQLPNSLVTDLKRLQQILKNLLSNAFKFTHHGHVALSIEEAYTGWSPDHEELNRAQQVISFAVTDTGIGISADKQQIIFEAFQQADGSTSRTYGGTGLGLAISRELSRLLGGEIRLSSAPGEGSSFVLYLPLNFATTRAMRRPTLTDPRGETLALVSRRATLPDRGEQSVLLASEEEPATPINEASDDRQNIQPGDRVLLIVENDLAFAGFLLDAARAKGFKGLVTSRGAGALTLATQFMPSAITLDMYLPDMDGWRVLDRLKQDTGVRHIPVCVISTDDSKDRAYRSGALAFVEKPIPAKEVLDHMLEQLHHYVTRDSRKVLLHIGDADVCRQISAYLEDESVSTVTATSGSDVVELLKSGSFDCLLADEAAMDAGLTQWRQVLASLALLGPLPVVVYRDGLIDAEESHAWQSTGEVNVREARSLPKLFDLALYALHISPARLSEQRHAMLKNLHESNKSLAGKRVLIVDDDMRNIFALATVLEEEAMDIVWSDNGRDAIARVADDPLIRLVLMDIMMPVMDGMATMQAIRKLPAGKNLPIIAVTAKAMKGDREKCIEAGAWDYLSKPVNTEDLLAVLRAWLPQ